MIRVPLAPVPGVNTNETDFSIPNQCTDANMVRWRDGKPEPIGGWSKEFASQFSGVCRNILTWTDLDSLVNIALGTNSKLYVYRDGTLTDITPSGLSAGALDSALPHTWGAGEWGDGDWGEGTSSDFFARTWSLANWGENLIACPRGGGIYSWENDTSSAAAALSNAPAAVNTIAVTPERQVLAFGCTQSVSEEFDPLTIRGSDTEDNTTWAIASDNLAFEDKLEGAGIRIITGKVLGSYVPVWTDQGLFVGQFTGDVTQVYKWDLIGVNCGLIGPNAVVIVNQRAFWITPGLQFYTWAPGEAPSAINCPLSAEFQKYLVRAQGDKIAGTAVNQFGEIWWFYPDSRDGTECSRFINFTTRVPAGQPLQWSKGILARTAAIDAGIIARPLMAGTDGYLYAHEDGQTANGGALSGFYTIELPYLEEGGRFVLVKGLEPDFKDQSGALTLTLTLKKYPQSTVTTGSKVITIAAGSERKHFLAQGRSGTAKISWNSSPAYHRLGRPVLLAEPTGQE